MPGRGVNDLPLETMGFPGGSGVGKSYIDSL